MLLLLCLAMSCAVASVGDGGPLRSFARQVMPRGGHQSVVAAAPSPVRVQLAPDRSTVALAGRVQGYETVDYVLDANPQDRLSVRLTGATRYLQMGIYTPDGAALCVETCDRQWTGQLPHAGDYIVRIGLVRAEARRQGRASYTVHLALTR
jgi:hypothetical protein